MLTLAAASLVLLGAMLAVIASKKPDRQAFLETVGGVLLIGGLMLIGAGLGKVH